MFQIHARIYRRQLIMDNKAINSMFALSNTERSTEVLCKWEINIKIIKELAAQL